MTDFMTAHPVTLIQPTFAGDPRAKGVQFQSACSLCRDSHKTQVWLRFLVLSFLSTYTCAASVPGTADVKICLKMLKHAIEKSDAMLYAPSVNDVECRQMFAMLEKQLLLQDFSPLNQDFAGSDRDMHASSFVERENCKSMSLRCYMLELIMVIDEEEIVDNNAECVSDFNETLLKANSVGCLPCEAYSLKNITVFLERLNNLLEEMTVRWNNT